LRFGSRGTISDATRWAPMYAHHEVVVRAALRAVLAAVSSRRTS
jgi:hypothetical protein